MVGRLHGIIVDCPDPSALASFYERLLGMIRVNDEADWVVIGESADRPGIAFQRVARYVPPRWPDPAHPQQMHFDVRVDDLDSATEQALALGAVRREGGDATCRIFLDPAGHPFCLVVL